MDVFNTVRRALGSPTHSPTQRNADEEGGGEHGPSKPLQSSYETPEQLSREQYKKVLVKNTFLEVVLTDSDESEKGKGKGKQASGLKKSASEGTLSQRTSDSSSTISSSLGSSSKDCGKPDHTPGIVGLHLKHIKQVQEKEQNGDQGYCASADPLPPYPLPMWAAHQLVDNSDEMSSSQCTSVTGTPDEKAQIIHKFQQETGMSESLLEALFDNRVLLNIPRNEDGDLLTIGSMSHPEKCKACVFWYKGSCNKGIVCEFCHFLHDGQKKKRIRLSKRTRVARKAQEDADAVETPRSNDGEDRCREPLGVGLQTDMEAQGRRRERRDQEVQPGHCTKCSL